MSEINYQFRMVLLLLSVLTVTVYSYAQISTDTIQFKEKPEIILKCKFNSMYDMYSSIYSTNEGFGYAGASILNRFDWFGGVEISPGLALNNNLFSLNLGYMLKRIEMDVQTVTAPPWPPPRHSLEYYPYVWIGLPSYGYMFRLNDLFRIVPEMRINLRMQIQSEQPIIPSLLISPRVSVFMHAFGIFGSFNLNLSELNYVDEKYSVVVGICYFPFN